ncbi:MULTISPECIES: GNAT family N-acetyltransferase [unclassified Haematobacter]|uniref:GNAT family N-acetyltransferase n=1 Tax=unclassified Haematobacter TaxID=2640585 RepID=UPI0025BC0C56|nr:MULTISPECIES: GNAT family N-acetyltransferase [unclassified Haematobacter]
MGDPVLENIAVRHWLPTDTAACLAIFDSNVPGFFAPSERDAFETHLRTMEPATYLVLLSDERVLACGGLSVDAEAHRAILTWGMVDRAAHRRGLGGKLTEARLALARRLPGITEVALATSQHTRAFYERFGFIAAAVTPDGFGDGLDRWDMVLRLQDRPGVIGP